jgi:hypothetical protein
MQVDGIIYYHHFMYVQLSRIFLCLQNVWEVFNQNTASLPGPFDSFEPLKIEFSNEIRDEIEQRGSEASSCYR